MEETKGTNYVQVQLNAAPASVPTPIYIVMWKRSRSPDPFHIKLEEDAGPSIRAYEATIIRSQPDAARKVLLKHSDDQPGGLVPWSCGEDAVDSGEILTDRYVCPLNSVVYLVLHASRDICLGTFV